MANKKKHASKTHRRVKKASKKASGKLVKKSAKKTAKAKKATKKASKPVRKLPPQRKHSTDGPRVLISARISSDLKKKVKKDWRKAGFKNLSDYVERCLTTFAA